MEHPCKQIAQRICNLTEIFYPAWPKNDRICSTIRGGGRLDIRSIFALSTLMLFLEITCPKTIPLFTMKSHFSQFAKIQLCMFLYHSTIVFFEVLTCHSHSYAVTAYATSVTHLRWFCLQWRLSLHQQWCLPSVCKGCYSLWCLSSIRELLYSVYVHHPLH